MSKVPLSPSGSSPNKLVERRTFNISLVVDGQGNLTTHAPSSLLGELPEGLRGSLN
jgi:hypothetical protein